MMLPPRPAATSRRATACATVNIARTLRSSSRSRLSSATSRNGSRMLVPALLTRMSKGSSAAMKVRTAARSVTSSRTARADRPAARKRWAVCSHASRLRAASVTSAPACARAIAAASPNPPRGTGDEGAFAIAAETGRGWQRIVLVHGADIVRRAASKHAAAGRATAPFPRPAAALSGRMVRFRCACRAGCARSPCRHGRRGMACRKHAHTRHPPCRRFRLADGVKRSSAQITTHYRPEDLLGRQVVAAVNLPPKRIGTFTSEVLVLGLPDAAGAVVLLRPDRPVPNGGRVY